MALHLLPESLTGHLINEEWFQRFHCMFCTCQEVALNLAVDERQEIWLVAVCLHCNRRSTHQVIRPECKD